MFGVWRYLALLHVGLSGAYLLQPNDSISKLNCSSLCGVPPVAESQSRTRLNYLRDIIIPVKFGGDCARASHDSNGDWERSAGRFLRLINMNDTTLGCPKWNAVFPGPNSAKLPRFLGSSIHSYGSID